MNIQMQKANMLAEQINAFITFVDRLYLNKSVNFNSDKMYQVKLWIDEYKFQTLAKELLRINRFSWDEQYTYYLVEQFQKGTAIIKEYVEYHYEDLFLLTARLYTLNNLCSSLKM